MADAGSPQQPMLTGYLYKSTQGTRVFGRLGWKRRWFCLDPASFALFTSGKPLAREAARRLCALERSSSSLALPGALPLPRGVKEFTVGRTPAVQCTFSRRRWRPVNTIVTAGTIAAHPGS